MAADMPGGDMRQISLGEKDVKDGVQKTLLCVEWGISSLLSCKWGVSKERNSTQRFLDSGSTFYLI